MRESDVYDKRWNGMCRKLGLSGIIRAKNEGRFIGESIDSVIDSVDELIVVYNDCTDNTEEILAAKKKQYPDKLKIYSYNYQILYNNLSREEFDYAVSLPETSNRLHSSQCNFCLSKASFSHAVKIDPDQIYIADEMKKWRDVCSETTKIRWSLRNILGCFFMNYFSIYRRLSLFFRRPQIWMLPDVILRLLKNSYLHYVEYRLQKGNAAISLSGINLYYEDGWYIPFDRFNIHPPYNGEGDTVIFKISDETFYKKSYDNSNPTKVTEIFVHPYRVVISPNPAWFHLHALRFNVYNKVLEIKHKYPGLFVRPSDFVRMNYRDVLQKMGGCPNRLFQQILFVLIHKMGADSTKNHILDIDSIKVELN